MCTEIQIKLQGSDKKQKKLTCGHDRVSVMGQFKGSGTGILTCRFSRKAFSDFNF